MHLLCWSEDSESSEAKTERANALSPLECFIPLNPTTAPEQMLTMIEWSKPARNIGGPVIRNRPLPHYQGCSQGMPSEWKDPPLFPYHMKGCFAYSDAEEYRLLADQQVEG